MAPDLVCDPKQSGALSALRYIVSRYGIPLRYALELIEGTAMDVRGTCYDTSRELLLYCYRFQPWSPDALRTIWKYSNVQ